MLGLARHYHVVDTAFLVAALVVGFALIVTFFFRLTIEERFDGASIACLLGGLAFFGVAAWGRGHPTTTVVRNDDAKMAEVQTRLQTLHQTADRVDHKADAAMNAASKALTTAESAKERASLSDPIARLQKDVADLRAELAQTTVATHRKKSAWSMRIEARIAAIERQIRTLSDKVTA